MTAPETNRRRRSGPAWWIALILSLALVGVASWSVVLRPDAKDVVREYLEAILDRDVEGALAYTNARTRDDLDTGSGEALSNASLYSGAQDFDADQSRLLHPDAISTGWEILDIGEPTEGPGSYIGFNTPIITDSLETVEVVIGHEGGTARFTFALATLYDRLTIVNGLVAVPFSPSPNLFVQTGDRLVEFDDADALPVLAMFPGVYEFTVPGGTAGPVAIAPGEGGNSPIQTALPQVPDEQLPAAEEALRALIDDCVTSDHASHHACPFGTEGEFTAGGQTYGLWGGVRWTLEKYPTFELDFSYGAEGWYLQPEFTDPGRLTVSETDSTDEGEVLVTAECEFYDDDLYVYFHPDGAAEVTWGPRGTADEDFAWVQEETCADTASVEPVAGD
ncbi:hypothetical protein [Glycomyces buryatensis]|uniref:Uncharacterized protein n=1 Tax=Glycomyces buryatensis TaxID=2570927 RepID=A0A4S8QAS8_9ACTN|nr:hypothetical protein [Glycomyces buryatensis]THV41438.1 hypothetical protein FAB82_11610 [Glycomyces buryatensis]